jgi:hypothetical protein
MGAAAVPAHVQETSYGREWCGYMPCRYGLVREARQKQSAWVQLRLGLAGAGQK